MLIVCDVDGVLNNLMEVTLNVYNQKYGTEYSLNDISSYNLENCFDHTTAKRMKQIFCDVKTPIWDKVKPIAGAQDALEQLLSKNHQVYLATDNDPNTYGQKVAWVKRFFPFIDSSKIICIKDKWLLRADIMIEDNIQTLLAKPYYHRICFDYPWNQYNYDEIYGIHRCHNWDDIVDEIEKINEFETE